MNSKKVIYFTKTATPSTAELAEIAAIDQHRFDLYVRPADINAAYGDRPESTDFVSGSVPDMFADVPVWSNVVLGQQFTVMGDATKVAEVVAITADGIEVEIKDAV